MDNLIQFFDYDHLPDNLKGISKPFSDVAFFMLTTLPKNPESTVAMRKLLEAKDCAVRSVLYKAPNA